MCRFYSRSVNCNVFGRLQLTTDTKSVISLRSGRLDCRLLLAGKTGVRFFFFKCSIREKHFKFLFASVKIECSHSIGQRFTAFSVAPRAVIHLSDKWLDENEEAKHSTSNPALLFLSLSEYMYTCVSYVVSSQRTKKWLQHLHI